MPKMQRAPDSWRFYHLANGGAVISYLRSDKDHTVRASLVSYADEKGRLVLSEAQPVTGLMVTQVDMPWDKAPTLMRAMAQSPHGLTVPKWNTGGGNCGSGICTCTTSYVVRDR